MRNPNSEKISEPSGEACPIGAEKTARRSECDAAPYRLPKFTLGFVALATAFIAVWCGLWPITSVASRVVLAVIGLTYLFGCARTRRAVLVMIPALYLPHTWIFLMQAYPWSDYRWFWVKMFWQLPGLVPEAIVRQYTVRSEWWPYATMAIAAVVIWLAVVTLARRGGTWLWGTAAATFFLSAVCAWIEYGLFRM